MSIFTYNIKGNTEGKWKTSNLQLSKLSQTKFSMYEGI